MNGARGGGVHTARREEPGHLIGFAPSEGLMDQVESFRGVPDSGSVEGDDIPDEVLNELISGWAGSLFGGQAMRVPQDFLTWQDLRAFNLLPGIAESFLEILIIVWLALTVWCCAGGAARRVKHAHGRKGFLTHITEWEGSHNPVVAAALAPIQAAWLLMAMPVYAVIWGLMRIFGTVWAVVQFLVVGVQGIIGSDEDRLNNAKARESEEAPVARKKKKQKKQKAIVKQRSVDKEEPVDVEEVGTAAEVRDMDPRRSAATVSEEEYMLRKMQEEEDLAAAREHAAVRMRERREFEFVEKIERKRSLDKERALSAKEATDPPKPPAKKEKKPRPAPVIVPPTSMPPSRPHLNGAGVHGLGVTSPTKGPPPLPRGPPPANQPKRWDGRPGTRPPLPAGPPPANLTNRFAALTPMSPTAEGGDTRVSLNSVSLNHRGTHLADGWNEEKETRRRDELVNSVLESLTSGPIQTPGYGARSRSQSTTPTGAVTSVFGGGMWSPSGAGASDGGFSLFSGGSNPTSPTAGELNRRRNRLSH